MLRVLPSSRPTVAAARAVALTVTRWLVNIGERSPNSSREVGVAKEAALVLPSPPDYVYGLDLSMPARRLMLVAALGVADAGRLPAAVGRRSGLASAGRQPRTVPARRGRHGTGPVEGGPTVAGRSR